MDDLSGKSAHLTVGNIIKLVQADPCFPEHRRVGVLSSLRCVVRWLGKGAVAASSQGAGETVLIEGGIAPMFRGLAPSVLGISRKRLRNAQSDLRFVLRFYERAPQQAPSARSDASEAIESMVSGRFDEMSLRPLLRYLASKGIDPWQATDEDAEAFREMLCADRNVRCPRRVARRAVHAWNKEQARNPQWPQIKLSLRDTRPRWGLPWSAFPVEFRDAVDQFFCRDETSGSIFEAGFPRLAPATCHAQADLLRLAASACVLSGVEPATIVGLRNVCAPAAFRAALQQIVTLKGGVTSTVQNVAHVLRKVGKQSGALSMAEMAEVDEAYKNLRRHFDRRPCPRIARDQEVLDRLDDSKLVDALLSLPTKAVAAILRSRRKSTRTIAIQVQLALALELLFCAPLRIKNLVALSVDRHFFHANLNGANVTLLRIPGDETKNGEPAEHILTEDTASLLLRYVEVYRPLISIEPGEWLFPGGKGGHKTENTLATQLSSWVCGEIGIAFHPHLMRKIVPKLYLDKHPGGLEVARRLLGHRSDEMLRKTYLQNVHRASQQKYIDALEERRLDAFRLARVGGNGGRARRSNHG